MEGQQAVERRRGLAAGDRPDERLALELAGPVLELLLDQGLAEQPVRLALEALGRQVLAGPLAGVAGLDQPVEEDARDGAVALGLLAQRRP